MEEKVDRKLDNLEKYVPFLNYLIEIDNNKYKKFSDIKSWILSKKRYPITVLEKIEQSIITQYRNLFYEDKKLPKSIMAIFNTFAEDKCFSVDLCSDDEDDVIFVPLSTTARTEINQKSEVAICVDSDDDLNDNNHNEITVYREETVFKRRSDFPSLVDENTDAQQTKPDKRKKSEEEKDEGENNAPKLQIAAPDQRKDTTPRRAGSQENSENIVESSIDKYTNLENMHIDKLKQMYDDLTKEKGIDVEKLLKELNLIVPPNQNYQHDSVKQIAFEKYTLNSNRTQNAAPFSPRYENLNLYTHRYPQINSNEMSPIVLQQNGFKLNLKDPRIVKQLLAGNINSAICIPRVGGVNYASNYRLTQRHEPTTYGEYKRLQAEEEAKAGKSQPKTKEQQSTTNTASVQRQCHEIPNSKQPTKKATKMKNSTQQHKSADLPAETYTDLRSMLLNAFLPYGDKILDVLRQKNTLKGSDIKEKTSVTTEAKTKETATATLEEQQDTSSDVECFKKNAKCDEIARTEQIDQAEYKKGTKNAKKAVNLKRKANRKKEANMVSIFKRRRIISTSSEELSSDILAVTAAPTTKSVSATTSTPNTNKSNSALLSTLRYKPIVKLKRLSPAVILKYSRPAPPSRPLSENSKILNVELVEIASRKSKGPTEHLTASKTTKQNVKCKNIDALMTNRNTTFCALCKSKPTDLTNHYKRTHKTESYVARLSSATLNSLTTNIPFVQNISKGTKANVKRYAVKCAFCDEDLEDKFINFYKHFSTHTGEYAFQCSICKLEKPFEVDIQSHKCHSKTCRNGRLKYLYQYPPHMLVIYLYSCKICNFVQLNEANTFKHLRDHHDRRQDDSSFIGKYILAAINDEETCEINASGSDTNFQFLNEDEGILVSNEPIAEDTPDFVQLKSEQGELAETTPQRNGKRLAVDDMNNFNNISPMVIIPNSNTKLHNNSGVPNSLTPQNVCIANSLEKEEAVLKLPPLSLMENMLNTSDMCAFEHIKTESTEVFTSNESPAHNINAASSNYSNKKPLHNSTHTTYRAYPKGVAYFGLYKCMAADCLFSTEFKDDILVHLNDHGSSVCPPPDYLQCAYCQLDAEVCTTPDMLIAHIDKCHQQSGFQCAVCCYRGCSPNHVLAHMQHMHPLEVDAPVYQCMNDVNVDSSVPSNISELLQENVESLNCPCKDCPESFQSLNCLQKHLIGMHCLALDSNILAAQERYACIYCPKRLSAIENVQRHLVASHPNERPYICERILTAGKEDDSLQNLAVTFVSLPSVPIENIKQVNVKQEFLKNDEYLEHYDVPGSGTPNPQDVTDANAINNFVATQPTIQIDTVEAKPNLERLTEIAKDGVNRSLLKLTASTGISPNVLYHCPRTTCGGFFSTYDIWHRHMSLRHGCIISECPHCTNKKKAELPLTDFKAHFQMHCCHLYGCFHCGVTFSNEQAARDHMRLLHADINTNVDTLHNEQLPLFFNQSFILLMKCAPPSDRYSFLLELQAVLRQRCEYVEKLLNDTIKTQWIVPYTASWLENVPCYKHRKYNKCKCFCQNCSFQTYVNEELYAHLIATHRIYNHTFKCANCDFRIVCDTWFPIIDHIKMHVLNIIYICCVCSYYHYDRRRIYTHIKEQHRCRDVPIVTLLRSMKCLQMAVAVVFAQRRKTFSTINSCFLCNETNTSWSTFATHLKRTHHLTLRYFCAICDTPIKLIDCEQHFVTGHPSDEFRLRCELATNNQLSIDSITPIKMHIADLADASFAAQKSNLNANKIAVKQEPGHNEDDGSDLEVIDDDDIVIAEDAKLFECQRNRNVIRCVNLENLQRHELHNNICHTHIMPQQQQQQQHHLSQMLTPTAHVRSPAATNNALILQRMAAQSPKANFTADCNIRPVKITTMLENSGNPTNDIPNIQQIQNW